MKSCTRQKKQEEIKWYDRRLWEVKESVFISYSSKDSKIVEKIVAMLKEAGISYWKAPEMIPAGSNYAREIPRAIAQCQVFLLVISSYSQESIWVEKEIDCAINDRKTIVPLKLTEDDLSDMFRFYLNNVQTISYAENPAEALRLTRERLNTLLSLPADVSAEQKKADKPEKQEQPKPAGRQKRPVQEGLAPHLKQAMRGNALKMNKTPVVCENCGGELTMVSRGTYKCKQCGNYCYDTYQTIRNFLDANGPSQITVIARETGIPRKTIEYFLWDDRLEVPLGSSFRLKCEKCGMPIRSGHLCETCKEKQRTEKNIDQKYHYFGSPERRG